MSKEGDVFDMYHNPQQKTRAEMSDHDLLIRIDERLEALNDQKLDERVSTLENWKNYHTGALAILTGGIILISTILF